MICGKLKTASVTITARKLMYERWKDRGETVVKVRIVCISRQSVCQSDGPMLLLTLQNARQLTTQDVNSRSGVVGIQF